MKRKFKSSILVLFTVCCLAVPLQAVQHSPPWADNYDFNYVYPIVPYSLVLDTRPYAANTSYYQNLMGYAGHAYTDYSAAQAFNYLPDGAIFSFDGHGNNQALLYVNQTAASRIDTAPYDGRIPNVYYLSDFNSGELNDVIFALFLSCHTAEVNPIRGNWITHAMDKGVDNAIGFTGNITNNKAKYWAYRFWNYNNLNYNIYSSAYLAAYDTALYPPIGGPSGFENWVFGGNWQTKLKPARYGI